MPQQELEAGIAAFEARVGLVEDIEKIRKLVASYGEYLDSLPMLDELRPLFTGEKAKGRWCLLCPLTSLTPEGPLALWKQGT